MAKQNFYAVYKGKSNTPKIFTDWNECKNEINGVSCAIYKKFKTKEDAINFIEYHKNKDQEINIIDFTDDSNSINIYIDGSFNSFTNEFAYGLVAIKDDQIIYQDADTGDKNASSIANVAGEILGAMKAAQYSYENNYDVLNLYYDYAGIEFWATGNWKTKNEFTKSYKEYIDKASKYLKINFIKIKGHSGDKWNEYVDKLAKKAAGVI